MRKLPESQNAPLTCEEKSKLWIATMYSCPPHEWDQTYLNALREPPDILRSRELWPEKDFDIKKTEPRVLKPWMKP